MKRSLFGLLVIAMLVSLASCGNRNGEPSETVSGITTIYPARTTDETKIQGAEKTMESGEFNFETKTVTLNSGYEMPLMGLGTYSLDYNTCISSVTAFEDKCEGLIDAAYM